jgi:polyferredoxin
MEAVDNTEGLAHQIREYVEIRIQEVKLDVADKSSAFMADVISRTLLFVIILLVILFASMAGAFVLGEMWDRIWLGFVVVSGFYVVLALVAWAIKERMIRIPIFNSILKHLTRKDDDD